MDSKFIPVSANDYPGGYFEAVAKTGKPGGGIIIGCGVVFLLLSLGIGYMAFNILLDVLGGEVYNDMVGGMIVLWVLALVFFVPAAIFFRIGRKLKKMDTAAWIEKSARATGYPESIIRDFGAQAARTDSIRFKLAGAWAAPSEATGLLTNDYISFGVLSIIKRGDVVGAYLANLPDSVSAGNKIKTVYRLKITIFSNHSTHIMAETNPEEGNCLIAMLKETNPNIDTADGHVLSDSEYRQVRQNLLGK